ncbi:MAG: plasmid mobilization protein [Oscillospiraceae bacterium]
MIEKEIIKAVRFSPEEMRLVQEKMRQLGTSNFSAFMRKMAIDGYVVKLELPELRELVSLLRYSSNNLNQLTRRVHESGRIYDVDLEDIHRGQEQLWDAAQTILDKLSKL